jgi:hypothetical protein
MDFVSISAAPGTLGLPGLIPGESLIHPRSPYPFPVASRQSGVRLGRHCDRRRGLRPASRHGISARRNCGGPKPSPSRFRSSVRKVRISSSSVSAQVAALGKLLTFQPVKRSTSSTPSWLGPTTAPPAPDPPLHHWRCRWHQGCGRRGTSPPAASRCSKSHAGITPVTADARAVRFEEQQRRQRTTGPRQPKWSAGRRPSRLQPAPVRRVS